jgi:hypothetical protein
MEANFGGKKFQRMKLRVARWHIFEPKIPNWVNFGGSAMEDVGIYLMAIWSVLRLFGIFCGHLVCFMVIWFSFSRFGIL